MCVTGLMGLMGVKRLLGLHLREVQVGRVMLDVIVRGSSNNAACCSLRRSASVRRLMCDGWVSPDDGGAIADAKTSD